MNAASSYKIFEESILEYHKYDDINHLMKNPYELGSVEALLYLKNWIDTVQWHLEDIIRDPEIDPRDGMDLKRLIDNFNQKRTNTVEHIDDYFLDVFKDVSYQSNAKLNTESPAWVLDRLSILALKIYHMQEQADRKDVEDAHRNKSQQKLEVLLEQRRDLIQSFDEMIVDIKSGVRYMKAYRQMKMYNDADTNPALYAKKG